jgi:hypothetical protein
MTSGRSRLKFKEHKISADFKPDIDTICAHCMSKFDDEDELARCLLTDHLTHAACVGHDQ